MSANAYTIEMKNRLIQFIDWIYQYLYWRNLRWMKRAMYKHPYPAHLPQKELLGPHLLVMNTCEKVLKKLRPCDICRNSDEQSSFVFWGKRHAHIDCAWEQSMQEWAERDC
jgi:hypothetical protein